MWCNSAFSAPPTPLPSSFHSPRRPKISCCCEGTDLKYGARHLKRAVDRHLVHPLSNLIATGQVRGGDLLRIDYNPALSALTFFKDAEDMPAYVMARMVDTSIAAGGGSLRHGRCGGAHSHRPHRQNQQQTIELRPINRQAARHARQRKGFLCELGGFA